MHVSYIVHVRVCTNYRMYVYLFHSHSLFLTYTSCVLYSIEMISSITILQLEHTCITMHTAVVVALWTAIAY